MREPPSYSKLPSRIFFLKQSVSGEKRKGQKAVCIFCLSFWVYWLLSAMQMVIQKRIEEVALDLCMGQKLVGLQTLVNVNIDMVVSLFLGIHDRYNFCPDLV